MKYLTLVARLVAFLLLAPGVIATDSRPERLAFEWPSFGSITVFSGTGERISTLKTRKEGTDHNPSRRVVYFSPSLHPDGQHLACIRCVTDEHAGGSPNLSQCKVIEWRFESNEKNTLLDLPTGPIASPAYSPDGKRLAVINGDDVVVFDPENHQITESFVGVFSWHQSGKHSQLQWVRVRDWYSYLVWSRSGGQIHISGRRITPPEETDDGRPLTTSTATGVGTIDLQTRQVTWMNLLDPWFIYRDHYMGRYVTISDGIRTTQFGNIPDAPATVALFGSSAHPVLKSVRSSASESYYYIVYEEGWFWRTKLMRFDPASGTSARIRTLRRGIYRE